MPASKLLLGLPLYGYVSRSTAKKLSGSSVPGPEDPLLPVIAHPRYPPTPETTKAPAGDVSAMWGQQIAFKDLLYRGALYKKPDGTYDGSNGYTKAWDDCSDTPASHVLLWIRIQLKFFFLVPVQPSTKDCHYVR